MFFKYLDQLTSSLILIFLIPGTGHFLILIFSQIPRTFSSLNRIKENQRTAQHWSVSRTHDITIIIEFESLSWCTMCCTMEFWLINQQGLLILWRKEHLVSLGHTPIVYLGTKAKFHWQTL
jgi:hypothetical protein